MDIMEFAILVGDNPLYDAGGGFKDAFYGDKHYTWDPLYTLLLAVFALILFFSSGWANSIFSRYRHFIRARRKEDKKKAYLARLLLGSGEDTIGESELLKRLIRYYFITPEAVGMSASPEQLLIFSKRLFRFMRNLEYNSRGRLVVPAMEKQLEEGVERGMLPEPEQKQSIAQEWKSIVRDHSKAARVALGLIRFNKPQT